MFSCSVLCPTFTRPEGAFRTQQPFKWPFVLLLWFVAHLILERFHWRWWIPIEVKLRRCSLWSVPHCCGHLFLSVLLTLGVDNPPSPRPRERPWYRCCSAFEFALIGPQKVKIPHPDWQSNNMGFVMTTVILLSDSKGPHINYRGNMEGTVSDSLLLSHTSLLPPPTPLPPTFKPMFR